MRSVGLSILFGISFLQKTNINSMESTRHGKIVFFEFSMKSIVKLQDLVKCRKQELQLSNGEIQGCDIYQDQHARTAMHRKNWFEVGFSSKLAFL